MHLGTTNVIFDDRKLHFGIPTDMQLSVQPDYMAIGAWAKLHSRIMGDLPETV